jgi:hypothetical protein
MKVVEDNLGGDKGEITGISTGFRTTFPPIDKANSVVRVFGQTKSIDE